MPTFDLFLPPQPYSTWRPKRRMHPIAAAWTLVSTWIERVRQRNALAKLDDRELRDIGITRVDAVRESEKPFWR